MKDNNKTMSDVLHSYRVMTQIAKKASSRVYLAHPSDSALERRVVIKIFDALYLESEDEQNRFLQEGAALARLSHPYILPILNVGVERKLPYIVAEYAPHGSLYDRLKHASHPLFFHESLQVLLQVGQALHYAHQQGVLHGNVKPENILFNIRDEALLADFNIGTMFNTSVSTRALDTRSASYMAPEQFNGGASEKSDQYALACIAYELFAWRAPFPAMAVSTIRMKHIAEAPQPLRNFNPDLPQHIEYAVLKAMEKDPEQRFESILDFVATLNAVSLMTITEPTVAIQSNAVTTPSTASLPAPSLPAHDTQREMDTHRQDALVYSPGGDTTASQHVVGVQPRGKRRVREAWLALAMCCLIIIATAGSLRFFTLPHTTNPIPKLKPSPATTVTVAPTVHASPTVSRKPTTPPAPAPGALPSPTVAPQPSPTPKIVLPTATPIATSMVTPTVSPTRPMLIGSLTASATTVNLTNEGSSDWIHWGLNTASEVDRKSGVTSQISTCTIIGGVGVQQYIDTYNGYIWSDGVPTTNTANTPTGIFVSGTNNGFSITVPASTTTRTLRVYAGIFQTQSTFKASLSDGSIPAYVDTSLNTIGDNVIGVYTLTYRAATNNGQRLTITLTSNSNNGGVTLQAATLH